MNALEALKEIKKSLKLFMGEETPVKLGSAKLKSGGNISYGSLDAGADIFIVDESGAQTPAPAGDHELEDGRIIVVAEPGKIAEVKEATKADEEQKMAEDPADPAGQAAPKLTDPVDWTEDIKWAKQAIASAAKQIASLTTAMQMFRENTGKLLTAMADTVEVIATEGEESPIKKPMQTVFSAQTDKKTRAVEAMQAAAKALSEKRKAEVEK